MEFVFMYCFLLTVFTTTTHAAAVGIAKENEQKDRAPIVKRSASGGNIAFSAYLGSYVQDFNNDKIVFDNTVLNEGNAYNRGTGEFTAPVNGTYLLSFQFENWANDVPDLQQVATLKVSGNVIASAIIKPMGRSTQAGNMAVVRLIQGQKAYVTVDGGNVYGQSSERFTFFTGALLYQ
ncbi:complement C1q-like protein 2 [Mercenaria mercenaria]|uniref:complement C1q-like protein 2 n=1 Tax=Mercenaria mercenaria TaxID=6596 RepID=UPI00234F6769|nr:complement C1q-like protein 2 [Mercenaria mercenaria]